MSVTLCKLNSAHRIPLTLRWWTSRLWADAGPLILGLSVSWAVWKWDVFFSSVLLKQQQQQDWDKDLSLSTVYSHPIYFSHDFFLPHISIIYGLHTNCRKYAVTYLVIIVEKAGIFLIFKLEKFSKISILINLLDVRFFKKTKQTNK